MFADDVPALHSASMFPDAIRMMWCSMDAACLGSGSLVNAWPSAIRSNINEPGICFMAFRLADTRLACSKHPENTPKNSCECQSRYIGISGVNGKSSNRHRYPAHVYNYLRRPDILGMNFPITHHLLPFKNGLKFNCTCGRGIE